MTGVAWWSQTAANNATYDPTISWSEGMAPSAVNDSARAEMASVAKWRDDIAGAIETGGTSTAYTVTTYQSFDTLARLNGQVVAFTPHTTNGATVTLNVDGLGAKPLRSAPSTELASGHLVEGTPYVAIYNSSDQAFYLQGFYGNPYSVMIGGLIPFTGSTAPNSSFILPYGQAISRSTYSAYFSLVSTAYGSGDGSTTFNVPDLRGRVVAGADGMGGSLAGRLDTASGMNGTGIGAVGGTQTHTLTAAQIPTLTSTGSNSITVTTSDFVITSGTGTSESATGGGSERVYPLGSSQSVRATSTGSNSISVTSQGTSGSAHPIIQPTIVLNYLLRII